VGLDPIMETILERRAVAIHAEGRATFDFGPAPYSNVIDVTHDSGRSWSVRLSDHLTLEGVQGMLDMLASLAQTGSAESMAFGLAWCVAASEVADASVVLGSGREVPLA